MRITIIGKGFVGKATGLLECSSNEIWFYDIIPSLCNPSNLTLEQVNQYSDIIFISVPTPMNIDGSCNTTIITSLLSKLNHPMIIIRSTVPIGFSNYHQCYFMPEFLTEKNWKEDFYNTSLWVFGYPSNIDVSHFQLKIETMIQNAYSEHKIKSNNILCCPNSEAEMIKLIRNNFLAMKVGFFNEIYDLCQSYPLDYSIIQKGVTADIRISNSHTTIDPEIRGYGGTCFPKDTNNLYSIFHQQKLHSFYLEASLYRNEYIDRVQKDWLLNYNRSFTQTNKNIYLMISDELNPIMSNILDVTINSNQLNIIKSNEIVWIYIGQNKSISNNFQNIIHKEVNILHSIFIPSVSKVYYFHNNRISLYKQMKICSNVLDFIETYQVPTIFYFENYPSNFIFLEMINEKKLSYTQTIMVEYFT